MFVDLGRISDVKRRRSLVNYYRLFPDADKQYLLSMKHREERTWVQAYLDQEKHVLRQMQGGCSVGMMPLATMRLVVTYSYSY